MALCQWAKATMASCPGRAKAPLHPDLLAHDRNRGPHPHRATSGANRFWPLPTVRLVDDGGQGTTAAV
jgi:hypothetical protein